MSYLRNTKILCENNNSIRRLRQTKRLDVSKTKFAGSMKLWAWEQASSRIEVGRSADC